MITILLGKQHERTVQRLRDQGCQVALMTSPYAVCLNELLTQLNDPFVCIVPPSSPYNNPMKLNVALINALKQTILHVPQERTGVLFEPLESKHRIPYLWNRTAVLYQGLTRGFTDTTLLPFEAYVLQDKFNQLSAEPYYTWGTLQQQRDGYTYSDKPRNPALLSFYPYMLRNDPVAERILPIMNRTAVYRLQDTGIMSTPPEFTLVMCCYNDGHYLPWALRSLMAQTYGQWELLLVDDGSDPPLSVNQLHPWQDDPRIRFITNTRNQGKASALNQALAMARGKWLIELDADDWLPPKCLEHLLMHSMRFPTACFLYGGHELWLASSRRDELRYAGWIQAPDPLPKWELFIDNGLPVAPRCFQIETLRQAGGWWTDDPFNGRLYEDIQMIARCLKLLPPQAIVPVGMPLYHRRVRARSSSQRNKTYYLDWKRWFMDRLNKA